MQTGPIQLTATANVAPSSNVNTVSLNPIADAEVASGKATSNFGTSSDIYIESAATGSKGNERGWLKFDLSSLPACSNIVGARLVMFCWSTARASMPAAVYPASTDSWTETGLTWNNQPGFGSAISTLTLASGSTNVSYSWDVTTFVQPAHALPPVHGHSPVGRGLLPHLDPPACRPETARAHLSKTHLVSWRPRRINQDV